MEGLKDYILREDAVAAVMETDPHVFLTYNKKKEKTDIVVAQITEEVLEQINKIPAADVEPRWIPVTERLPEEDKEVLISYRYKEGEGDTSHSDIDITSYGQMYFGGQKVGRVKHWRAPFEYFESNYEVIAWMPLPEPYKGGEEE